MPDIRLFQATATMIPTLAIAALLTGRFGQAFAKASGEQMKADNTAWRGHLMLWLPIICVVTVVGLGVRASLTALAAGEGSERQAFWACLAVGVELLIITASAAGAAFKIWADSYVNTSERSQVVVGIAMLGVIMAGIVCLFAVLGVPM